MMPHYYPGGKRALDMAGAGFLLLLFSPVLGVAIIGAWIAQGRPIFFVQERAGLGGRPIRVFKLRSMRASKGTFEPSSARVTPIGKLLRASSADELPQLVNVLLGDMSLVGPRPLYAKYIPRYSERQSRRLEVRPGITGLAQVHGRNSLAWESRLELDVRYVESIYLHTDLGILFRTVLSVLPFGSSYRTATSPSKEFLGSNQSEH